MLLRKKAKIKKGFRTEKITLNKDDTLLILYKTDENGEPVLTHKEIEAIHHMFKDKFTNVMTLPDLYTFKKIGKYDQ